MSHTVLGIGPGAWDSNKLAKDQEHAAAKAMPDLDYVLFRIYASNVYVGEVQEIVKRYVKLGGATVYSANGVWQGEPEDAIVVEFIGHRQDMQAIVNLAGDIRETGCQDEVWVTWLPIHLLRVTRP